MGNGKLKGLVVEMGIWRVIVLAGVIGVSSALAGCANTPDKPTYAEITFRHLEPILLDVGEIRVENAYKPPLTAPNVEHELPVKIDATIRRWASDRLRAVGKADAYAVLTIKEASVIEKPLKTVKGLSGFFTNDQSERYDFKISAELKIVTINGAKGLVTVEANRTKTVPENITLNAREMMYFERTEVLLSDFNTQMEKNIQTYLSKFLK